MKKITEIKSFNQNFIKDKINSLYICAGGFEDRTLGIIKQLKAKSFIYSLVFEYTSQKEDNDRNFQTLRDSLKILSDNTPIISPADLDNSLKTQQNLRAKLKTVDNKKISQVFIDISGMTNSLILQTLLDVNRFFYDKDIYIFYTEAESYYPDRNEEKNIYEIIKKKDIAKFGTIFSSAGAKETFILPDFNGKFNDYLPICLIFFVGYEPIRSKGLIEQYCPRLIVVCYGESPHNNLKWRTAFSRTIHNEVFKTYEHIDGKEINGEDFSTFDITDIVKKLENIYKVLYEDYNICITPQCSKLQAVATYIFTLTHPDVQVLFCLPGYFNPQRYSKGIGSSYVFNLFHRF